MNELMHQEILDQPEAVARGLPALRQAASTGVATLGSKFRRVIFTGSGDSYFAPAALQYAARQTLELPVMAVPALEAARYTSFGPADMLIVVSVSGEAARTVEAARVAASADARVIALTRAGDSSLARVAHEIVKLPEGSRSRRTPHTTDYLLTLLGVAILVEALTGRTIGFLDELPAIIRQSLDALHGPCSEIGRELAGSERFFILGAGPSFPTAEYGAAKFWESGGLVAFPFDLEEFAHGAHLLTEPGDVLFVVGPNGRSLDRAIAVAREAQRLGASVVHITDQYVEHLAIRSQEMAAVPEEWSPFVTSLPLQWLCWTIASAKSLDVVAKTGRAIDTQVYDSVQRTWIRDGQKPADR